MLQIHPMAGFPLLADGVLALLVYQNTTFILKPPFAPLKAKTFTAIERSRAHPFFKKNIQVSNTKGNVITPLYKMSSHILTYFPWYPQNSQYLWSSTPLGTAFSTKFLSGGRHLSASLQLVFFQAGSTWILTGDSL